MLTLVWTFQNSLVLMDRKGTVFTSNLKHRQNDFDDKFTEQDGFQIAIAITDSYNSDTDYGDWYERPLEDYANIEIQFSGWNFLGELEE